MIAFNRYFVIWFLSYIFPSIADPNEHLVIVLRELDVLTDWKSLGLHLGLNFSTLNEIQADERDTSLCKMAILHLWLSLRDSVKNKGGATEAALVKALYIMKENTLAHRIETKRFTSSHSPPPSCALTLFDTHITSNQMHCPASRERFTYNFM